MKSYTNIKLIARGKVTNTQALNGLISAGKQGIVHLVRAEQLENKISPKKFERVALPSISIAGALVKLNPHQLEDLNLMERSKIENVESIVAFSNFYKDQTSEIQNENVGVVYKGKKSIFAIIPLPWLPHIGIDNVNDQRRDIEMCGRLGICSYQISNDGLSSPQIPDASAALTAEQYSQECAEMFEKRTKDITSITGRLPEILEDFLANASGDRQEDAISKLEQAEGKIRNLLSTLRNNR